MVRKRSPGALRNRPTLRVVSGTRLASCEDPFHDKEPADTDHHIPDAAPPEERFMQKTPNASETTRATIFSAIVQATSFLSHTVSRPPWIGLVLLCTGSVVFEVTLFALLPLPVEVRALWPIRLLLILIAAMPALAAVVVAVAANRKAPIVDIEYPPARVPSVGAPLSRHNRWRDSNN